MCEGSTISTLVVCVCVCVCVFCCASVTQSEIISVKAFLPQFGGVREAAAAGRNKPCGVKSIKRGREVVKLLRVSHDCSHLLKICSASCSRLCLPPATPPTPPAAELRKRAEVRKSQRLVILSIHSSESLFMRQTGGQVFFFFLLHTPHESTFECFV